MSEKSNNNEALKMEYSRLIKKCREEIVLHNYYIAYDYAVQAKSIGEEYLEDDAFVLESEMFRGIAHLGIDKKEGNKILDNLYYGRLKDFSGNIDLLIKVKTFVAIAKLNVGQYDKAIRIFNGVIVTCKQELKTTKEKGADVTRYIKGIIYCLNQIAIASRCESQLKKYSVVVSQIENSIVEDELMDIEKVKIEIEKIHATIENNHVLNEAEKIILYALTLSMENSFREIEMTCRITYGSVLIEKGEYAEALKVFDQISQENYIKENLLVNVLNEMGIAKICMGKLEEGIEALELSWDYQKEKKDYTEVNRTLYGTALYYYNKGNLTVAYDYATIAHKKASTDFCNLELLYEVTLLQQLKARKNNREIDYIHYKNEYNKYKGRFLSNIKII